MEHWSKTPGWETGVRQWRGLWVSKAVPQQEESRGRVPYSLGTTVRVNFIIC